AVIKYSPKVIGHASIANDDGAAYTGLAGIVIPFTTFERFLEALQYARRRDGSNMSDRFLIMKPMVYRGLGIVKGIAGYGVSPSPVIPRVNELCLRIGLSVPVKSIAVIQKVVCSRHPTGNTHTWILSGKTQ